MEKNVPKKQSGTRRQSASKTGLKAEAADERRRPKSRRKNSPAGDCHHFISHMFQFGQSSTSIVIKSVFFSGLQKTRAKSTRRTSVQNTKTKAKATSKPRRKSSRTA